LYHLIFEVISLIIHLNLHLIELYLNLISLFLHPIIQFIDFIYNGIIDFFLEFVWLFNLPLDSLLHFLDDTIPLIFHIFSILIAFRNRLAQYYKVREKILVLIIILRHHRFSFLYHMKFDFIWLSCQFLHTILIRLADNCNDKVHKYDIAKDHDGQIYDPHKNF
jgi:hypothetical protein